MAASNLRSLNGYGFNATQLGGTDADQYALKTEYWKTIYPVGCIYISVGSTSPASLFGGTWEQLSARFMLGVGTAPTSSNPVLSINSLDHTIWKRTA